MMFTGQQLALIPKQTQSYSQSSFLHLYIVLLVVSVFRLHIKSLVHLELGFVQRDRYGSNFILLHGDIQYSLNHLLKILSFLLCALGILSDVRLLWLCTHVWVYLISCLCFCARTTLFLLLQLPSIAWSLVRKPPSTVLLL